MNALKERDAKQRICPLRNGNFCVGSDCMWWEFEEIECEECGYDNAEQREKQAKEEDDKYILEGGRINTCPRRCPRSSVYGRCNPVF